MKKSSVFFLVLTGAALLTSSGIVRATRPSSGMSDEQILRFMKLDPAAMHPRKTLGPDGNSCAYTDGVNEVTITRSSFSGVIVWRKKPEEKAQFWKLGKP